MIGRPSLSLDICRVAAFALALGAGACATPPAGPGQSAGWLRHQSLLAELREWRVSGRIAIRHEREGWNASLHWRQNGDEYVVRLSAPLGRGTVELSGSGAGVSMRTADNRLLHADSPELLMQDNLGWHVPLRGLSYWVRGLPEPGSEPDGMSFDASGRIQDLRQDGWHVSYERYLSEGAYELPGKMTLENRELRVRLVISDWIVPA
jgi:outer membrane lipoprotein LolB